MKTINILHIEDEPLDAKLVARALSKYGLLFNHTIVSTKSEFLISLQEIMPDIILSDHSLPEFNSMDALRILKQQGLHIPFILITGNSSEEFAVSVIKEGADDYILKDRMQRLPAAVLNALDKYEFSNLKKKAEAEKLHTELAMIEEMKRYNNRFQLATQSSAMGIWEWDILTGSLVWDAGMFALYNTDESQFGSVYDGWRSRLHPDDVARIDSDIQLAVDGLKKYDTEFRIIWPDSSIHFIKASGLIETDTAGRAIKMIGTNRDITKEKNAEILIQESENKYKSLVESNMDAILLTVKNGAILSANAAACTMFNMTDTELCMAGRNIVDKNDPRLAGLLAERELIGRAKGELNFFRKDGSLFPGEISSVVFTNSHGEERTSMTIRDISQRKAAEQAILNSEAFSRGILDSLNSHIAVIDTKGTIIKVNKPWNTFAANNGAQEWVNNSEGANYFDVFKTETVDEISEFEEVFTGIKQVISGTLKEFTWEYPCHSPWEERWFFMRVMKFDSAETLILIEHQYITERVLARQKIETSEKKYRQIVETAQEGIWMIDENNQTSFVNRRICDMLGYEAEEIIGLPFSNFLGPDEEKTFTLHQDDNEKETSTPYTSLITKEGKKIWVSLSTNTIHNLAGNYTGILAMVNDITERRMAEEKLRENQEQLLESQSIAHIGSWHVNLSDNDSISTCRVHCSDETFRIFGFQPNRKELSYLFFSKFIHPNDRMLLQESIVKVITDKSSYTANLRIADKKGNKKWVYLQAKVATDAVTGKPVKMFGTLKDITTRKEQELQIEKNLQERELLISELTKSVDDLKQFTFITSHNFRAPLSNLIGLLGLIDQASLTNDNQEIVAMFKNATQQLSKTIDDLVKILIIKNEVNVDVAANNISQVIDNFAKSFSHEIKMTRCSIHKDLEVETICFNESYFNSILTNLVSNALKYHDPQRALQIKISTKQKDNGDVVIIIKDNGTGIDLKRHGNKIFGLYQRFHSNADSIGLGLFMVKSQITAMGGNIEVESEEGVGTTFKITIKPKVAALNV